MTPNAEKPCGFVAERIDSRIAERYRQTYYSNEKEPNKFGL